MAYCQYENIILFLKLIYPKDLRFEEIAMLNFYLLLEYFMQEYMIRFI